MSSEQDGGDLTMEQRAEIAASGRVRSAREHKEIAAECLRLIRHVAELEAKLATTDRECDAITDERDGYRSMLCDVVNGADFTSRDLFERARATLKDGPKR